MGVETRTAIDMEPDSVRLGPWGPNDVIKAFEWRARESNHPNAVIGQGHICLAWFSWWPSGSSLGCPI